MHNISQLRPNRRRVNVGFRILRAVDPVAAQEAPESVTDALANLLHLCHAYGIDFDKRLNAARDHFCAELQPMPAGVCV